jgi:hypothetical protein
MEQESMDNIFKVNFKKEKSDRYKIKTITLQKTERCFENVANESEVLTFFLYQSDIFHGLN